MTEMMKLRMALDNAGIEWVDKSDARYGVYFERTHFTNKNGVACSVICGEFTYGGKAGLLESMPPVHYEEIDDDDFWRDEVEGYLTADEIIAEWV